MTVSSPTIIPPSSRPGAGTADRHTTASPIAGGGATANAVRGGSHVVGAFSLETFCDVGGLSYTHDDAQGFLNWLSTFGVQNNFWFADAGVKVWAYYEDYDNWEDTYGLDATLISYHSGHGGMDANGVFYVPMGAAWAGGDCTAVSSNMAVGNEYARYLFWSTCLSVRVHDGHDPYRTWSPANKGLRMIFGFETVSWDDPNYGKNFGARWNAGDSLSAAWLNASWQIAHDQAPSVVAMGASPEEAQHRVFNERNFEWGQASTDWYWWRWYDAVYGAERERNLALPRELEIAQLAPPSARSLRTAASRFGLDASEAVQSAGATVIAEGERQLSMAPDGTLVAQLGSPNLENPVVLDVEDAQAVATEAVRRYGLEEDGALTFDRIAHARHAGRSGNGDGSAESPATSSTIVQFRQLIHGLPVVTPGAGAVVVEVDNDGQVTSLTSSLRTVDGLSPQARSMPGDPPVPGSSNGNGNGNGHVRANGSGPGHEELLAQAVGRRLRTLSIDGKGPVGLRTVPGSTEIGYRVQGDTATVVAVRGIEVDFGQGLRKRYWVQAPLFA